MREVIILNWGVRLFEEGLIVRIGHRSTIRDIRVF